MTTIEMRRADPRHQLAAMFGIGQEEGGLAMPTPADLPAHEEYAHAVIRGCSADAVTELLRQCVDSAGKPAPGQFIQRLETLKLGGNGQRAFNLANGEVMPEISGVIVRVKSYRQLWDRRGKDDIRPGCASADSRWGFGRPGGECETCPEKVYRGKDIQYCRSKSRLYLVQRAGELPTVLELTAMAREGLRGYLDYCGMHGVPYSQLAVTLRLNLHPRNRPDEKGLNRATILAWQPIARIPATDGYSEALDFIQTVLSTAEAGWAMDIGEMGQSDQSLDTDDYLPPSRPAMAAPPQAARRSVAAPPPLPEDGQYGFAPPDNVDPDDLPF